LPAVEFTARFNTTVEPGLPEPEAMLTATCPNPEEEADRARRNGHVQVGSEAFLSMGNFLEPRSQYV
jgi:hypothetical protein